MQSKPKAIIGLGNPGANFNYTRHNIGFRIIDSLAQLYSGHWQSKDIMEIAHININNQKIILIKPQTYMNNSGKVLPFLIKQGIKAEDILVIHDELELPFGKIAFKTEGSAKGHNGLKSIINVIGSNFARLRFGIGRPALREMVPDYVLQNFKEDSQEIDSLINQGVNMIELSYT